MGVVCGRKASRVGPSISVGPFKSVGSSLIQYPILRGPSSSVGPYVQRWWPILPGNAHMLSTHPHVLAPPKTASSPPPSFPAAVAAGSLAGVGIIQLLISIINITQINSCFMNSSAAAGSLAGIGMVAQSLLEKHLLAPLNTASSPPFPNPYPNPSLNPNPAAATARGLAGVGIIQLLISILLKLIRAILLIALPQQEAVEALA